MAYVAWARVQEARGNYALGIERLAAEYALVVGESNFESAVFCLCALAMLSSHMPELHGRCVQYANLATVDAKRCGQPESAGVASAVGALALAREAKFVSAKRAIQAALGNLPPNGDLTQRIYIYGVEAQILMLEGSLAEATTCATNLITKAKILNSPDYLAYGQFVLALCESKLGRIESARAHATDALNCYTAIKHCYANHVATFLEALA